MADLDLGPGDERNKDWLDRLEAEQEYLKKQFEPQPEQPGATGPPGFEPKPRPGKEICRKYYQTLDLGDIETKFKIPGIGEVATVGWGDDLGLDDTGKVNVLDVPNFDLPKKSMDRVNEAAQVTEIGEHLGGYWQWGCIDFSKPEYYQQIGKDWFVTAGVELVRDTVVRSTEDWRDGVPEDTLVRTPDGCVIPVDLLSDSANLDGATLWMKFGDLAGFRQKLEKKIEESANRREELLEERKEGTGDEYVFRDLREESAKLRRLKNQLEHFNKWIGELSTPPDQPLPVHRRPRLRVPSLKDMRKLTCEMMTLECLLKYYGKVGWSVDHPPTEEQARRYWEALAELREDFDKDDAQRLMKCVKKKWPDWLQPPTEEELEQRDEERRSKQPVQHEPISSEDRTLPLPGPEIMPTVPTMDMGQMAKYSRRAADESSPTSVPSISWTTSVIVGIIVGILIGVGSLVWWPVQQQGQGGPQDTTPSVLPSVCNYDGTCQAEAGERTDGCLDCRPTPTATRSQPTPTSRPAVPPPTPTLQPTGTIAPTPTPPPTATMPPTPTNTLLPAPEQQCSPGEWSECGGSPPEVVCDPEHISQCQADGTWGSCQWDPGRCAPSEPQPPSEEECVCGNGICESDTPCYESEYNCSADCGPPPCDRWLDAVDCDAARGRYICGLTECYCSCP
jgi:hypothetical protein